MKLILDDGKEMQSLVYDAPMDSEHIMAALCFLEPAKVKDIYVWQEDGSTWAVMRDGAKVAEVKFGKS